MTYLRQGAAVGNSGTTAPISQTTPQQLTRDLFDRGEPSYPAFPGSKGGETSRQAAEAIAPRARTWRGRVAKIFAEIHPHGLTADEAAKRLNATPFMIRPRVAELSKASLIEKTGERRPNPDSSLNAAVWRATELLRQTLDAPNTGAQP
ncbi:MAG: hypothetical protein Q7T86_19485 [Hyphomicrobiaceae bacterium]|nr:hypothetical protein [Hyphomicrobiaceae bacterium]